MTDLLITKALEPTRITEAYSNLMNKVNAKISLDVELNKIDDAINEEFGNLVMSGVIDGKNEETRKAQKYVHTVELQKEREKVVEKLIYAKGDIDLAQMQIEMHKQVIRYFSTVAE